MPRVLANIVMMLAALVFFSQLPANPLDFGRMELEKVAGDRLNRISLQVKRGGQPESYTITPSANGRVSIVGSDPNGAMYGALELAERLRNQGEKGWQTKAEGKPFLRDRGLNLFLTLPWNYAKNDTDYDPAALTDPNRWWFQNDDYWTTLLDLMAKSRLNWLDIHGAWDISVTNAPNLYAYFVTSPTFPKVGVSEEIKAQNLARLNKVIAMAHARGIRVSLMAYEANLRIPQNPNPGYEASEKNIYTYTREVVEQMIRRCPKLDGIGFRIGESGRGEDFFHCYGEAVRNSGRQIPLITRSWITRKQKVLPLARTSSDFTVEIKYNGEQWGSPYMVAGGRVANWHSYSFEDYLSDSGSGPSTRPGPTIAALQDSRSKLWPGNPTPDGGKWPDQPYKIVWQVRANGTHRIFPFYNPDWVRRTIKEMPIGTASGYTIEGLDAYYPKSPDYYLANPKDKYCDWIHQRDEMYWMTWGRLGYDPTTPDETFDYRAEELLGKDSKPLVKAWKDASVLIPLAFMAYALGPDHRDHAPELEWGGDTSAYIQGQPFDSLSFMPVNEELANKATGGIDGRYSMWDFAMALVPSNESVKQAERAIDSASGRVREIGVAVRSMTALSSYYALRFRSAHVQARLEATYQSPRRLQEPNWFHNAIGAHRLMVSSYYRPLTERLRMRTNTFSWNSEVQKLLAEEAALNKLPFNEKRDEFYAANMSGPMEGQLTWSDKAGVVTARLTGPKMGRAWLLVKPLPSSTYFHKIPMKKSSSGFEATFPRQNWGHAIAAEATSSGDPMSAGRFPGIQSATPYMIIPAQPGPTPQIYSAEEAMAFLDPKVLTPEKYGAILIGTRAFHFFHRFDNPTKRKLLLAVEKGLKLVILQEDFARSKLDFLPRPLKFENVASDTFDPGGQLGLPKVVFSGIMYQRFLPSDGWQVFGNGGLARLKLGKGEVWVTSARLMQSMHIPSAAKSFVKMLSLGGKAKPTVLVDSSSEGGPMTSSCHADLMNSHEIPFLTLGEVIAEEQGMNSFTVIPGPKTAAEVLNGKGSAIANAFLKRQVQEWSRRPTPGSRQAFVGVRRERKAELLRSLGLNPMPPKTPLNARITGTLQRNGYRIEKLVFESRPKFYATAHIYIPDSPDGPVMKRPLVVNVNGHWAHKKNEDRLQLPAAFQALQGYIAVTIDSPGWSFEGNALIERRAEGDHNDFFLVQGGTNTTGYYVWDCIRLLDYMATRPDVDMDRIGITGASGGGLATLYAFAADDRYKAAVPVVYMSSQELAPDNGCLCNHVPGVCQIGDRSDVIAIQAPKPVLLMGAENDGEFPPDATRLTHKKISESWALFPAFGSNGERNGPTASQDVFVQIFPGGHDYNQPMRERMIGFFNRYLRGVGDGTPVPQPAIETFDPEKRDVLVLDPPPKDERTMRDLSKEYLASAKQKVTAEQAIDINGGMPLPSNLALEEWPLPDGSIALVFESEPGLKTPGIYKRGTSGDLVIFVSDDGKVATLAKGVAGGPRESALYLDILGAGELANIELRYPVYLGRSVPFMGGWQIVRAISGLAGRERRFRIVADGPIASQAAMWAALMEPRISGVQATNCLEQWSDVFNGRVSEKAIQPRAHLLGSLANLRSMVANSTWKTRQ